jgi:ABC-type transporter Mla MlaB component
MSDLRHNQEMNGTTTILHLAGVIDEDVVFPVMSALPGDLNVDLANVSSINSVGIREWLNWIRPLAEKSKVTLQNCPKSLVLQMNMVEGFLPKNGQVVSFYVPYYCETCDREHNVLFEMGKHVVVQGGNYKINFDVKTAGLCTSAECDIEMDASESKYFQFLKRAA